MADNTRFYLKNPKSKGDSLVMGCFTFNHQYFEAQIRKYSRIRFSTDQRITVKHWKQKNQKAIETKDFPLFGHWAQKLFNCFFIFHYFHLQTG